MPDAFPEKVSSLVKVREIIYPYYDKGIEEELLNNGVEEVFSFGNTQLGKYRVIGKGKNGIVAYMGGGKVIKIRRSDSPKESLKVEAKIQSLAYPVSPRVYSYGKNFIIMEYVHGRHLSKSESIDVIIGLLRAAKELEDKKIEHQELVRPYKNVLISDKIYIIDYDDATIKEKARNVTSVLSWLKRVDLARKYIKGATIEDIIRELLVSFS
ncbi:serine/threonine protein kinase [Stygiolobus caldivivus]|uniref:Serine/threonine protein kinase n=1 Tax=Stygiolobus caldivivus TaxID=2824673 RepID=A0A8D5ZJJ7_9CREN|nr:serine/threonine protein kinase [Stygiolobus caldivivus]BCU70247.1 serine/threonine protein kinase [Stygiolobus caldivivus]